METGEKSIFVAGTDTSVGKTFIASLLLGSFLERGIGTGYQKWVSSGGKVSPDLVFCMENNGLIPHHQEQVPYHFSFPASPHLAGEMDGILINPQRIVDSFNRSLLRNEVLLVEGAGGLLVPLRRDLLLIDLLARLPMPTLLVAHSGLGTINHSLLSVEALRQRDIPVLGIVFSDGEEDLPSDDPIITDNMKIVAEMAGVPVFGRLFRMATYEEARVNFRTIAEAIWQQFKAMSQV